MNIPTMISVKIKSAIKGSIEQLLSKEYNFLGGNKIREMFAKDMLNLVEKHYKDPFHLDVGQILWYGVHQDDKPHYGKNSQSTQLVPIFLTLIHEEDLDRLKSGFTHSELRKYKVARLFKEAKEQGALLTNSDIAFLVNCSMSTVGKDVHKYMEENNEILPTRGIIHDIGPTFSHKRLILKMFLEGKQTPDIARSTSHSETACDRYIKAYRRVSRLHKDGKDEVYIGKTLDMSKKLVLEYVKIFEQMEKKET